MLILSVKGKYPKQINKERKEKLGDYCAALVLETE